MRSGIGRFTLHRTGFLVKTNVSSSMRCEMQPGKPFESKQRVKRRGETEQERHEGGRPDACRLLSIRRCVCAGASDGPTNRPSPQRAGQVAGGRRVVWAGAGRLWQAFPLQPGAWAPLHASGSALTSAHRQATPDDTTLIRWANTLQPETLHALNDRGIELAGQPNVTHGRNPRRAPTSPNPTSPHPPPT